MPKGPSAMNPNDFSWSYGSIPLITGQTGTGGNVISNVGAAFDQNTLNGNFKVLADKVNLILQVMKDRGDIS